MVIDFHTHTFPDRMAADVVAKLQQVSGSRAYTDGTVGKLQASMKQASIDYSISLPVMTNVRQVEKLNTLAGQAMEQWEQQRIIPFGGMHPDYPNYKKELRRIHSLGIPGIKIHPAYQGVDLDDIRFLRILDAASENDLIVLTHAGMDIGIPEHNFASVSQIQQVLKEVAPSRLVLAHMGGWMNWKQVKSDLAGAPVWLDTAFSLGKIEPAPETDHRPKESLMMDAASFMELVRAHGKDRILFATDSPWSSQEGYRKQLEAMPFTREEHQAILGENAVSLLETALFNPIR